MPFVAHLVDNLYSCVGNYENELMSSYFLEANDLVIWWKLCLAFEIVGIQDFLELSSVMVL